MFICCHNDSHFSIQDLKEFYETTRKIKRNIVGFQRNENEESGKERFLINIFIYIFLEDQVLRSEKATRFLYSSVHHLSSNFGQEFTPLSNSFRPSLEANVNCFQKQSKFNYLFHQALTRIESGLTVFTVWGALRKPLNY